PKTPITASATANIPATSLVFISPLFVERPTIGRCMTRVRARPRESPESGPGFGRESAMKAASSRLLVIHRSDHFHVHVARDRGAQDRAALHPEVVAIEHELRLKDFKRSFARDDVRATAGDLNRERSGLATDRELALHFDPAGLKRLHLL